MTQAQELHIEIPRGTVAALAWGHRDAPPILAVHGWLDNAASFIPLAEYLKDFRLIAVDLIGHGHSSHAPKGEYLHYIDYVADLAAIIDRMSWSTVTLLGHSLGAGIATILAGTIDDRINVLGLIDGVGPLTIDTNQTPELLQKSLQDYAKLPHKKLTVYPSRDAALEARLAATKMSRAAVELLVERGLTEVPGGYSWRTDPRLLCGAMTMYTENQIPAFLERIKIKTCFVRPSDGSPFTAQVINQRLKYLDNVEIEKVDGQHHVHMDKPQIVGTILNKFFMQNI